jgi:6-phosphogluconate dehydrogenase
VILKHVDGITRLPFIDVVADSAGQLGTGKWTVLEAVGRGRPMDGTAAAVSSRLLSEDTETRRLARNRLRSARDRSRLAPEPVDPDDVCRALMASRLVTLSQAFALLRQASGDEAWNLDLAAIAQVWSTGSIISSRLLEVCLATLREAPETSSLLVAPQLSAMYGECLPALRRVVTASVQQGCTAPTLAAGLSYTDALCEEVLPTALIQAQRDFMGAHTYRRVDRPGTFHTDWAGSREEELVHDA